MGRISRNESHGGIRAIWPMSFEGVIGLRKEVLDIDADLSGIQRDCTINGCQWLLVSWASLQQLADCGQQDRKPGYWIPSVAHLAITVPLVDHEVSVDAAQPGSSTDLALFPFRCNGNGHPVAGYPEQAGGLDEHRRRGANYPPGFRLR